MLPSRRTHRLPTFLLGCLTAALLTTQLVAQVGTVIDYTNGQTSATAYDTTAPNSPTTLSILSGTATQSGSLTGSGSVIKAGAGTLILTGASTYTGGTTLSSGSLEVTTLGAITHLDADMTVGNSSGDTGTLKITGGSVSNSFGYLGKDSGSSGTATVSGGTWTNSSDFYVGNDGTGVLNISGGSVSSGNGYLGYTSGSSGTATVSSGSWANSGELHVGKEGTGVLNISGGTMSSYAGYLGFAAGSSGTANVSGGSWTNTSDLIVGYEGSGVLNISGGSVSSSFGYVGLFGGGTATVSGGTWTNSSEIYVGLFSTGELNITDGGVVNSEALVIGSAGSPGTLNLGTGGTAGTLVTSVVNGSGAAVVNFNHTGSYTFTPVLTGGLTVNKLGSGTTVLTGTNTYSGATTVTSGTLLINGNSSAASSAVTVQTGATLGGSGRIGGAITVQNGGTLAPGSGSGPGLLTGTSASFSSGSLFSLEGGGAFFDRLTLSGAATLTPGALISFSISTALTQNSYTLMTAASGLDGVNAFSLSGTLPQGYKLVYTGTRLELDFTATPTAFWTGKGDSDNWSSGTTNWATAADGLIDTAALPGALTDVTFSATGAGPAQTNLDIDFTVYSLTVSSGTSISATDPHTLTVNTSTTVSSQLAIHSGVTLVSKEVFTIATTGTLAGSGTVMMENDRSMFVNGSISVGDPSAISPQQLNLYTNGTGAIIMGLDSTLHIRLNTGAGLGDNTANAAAADVLNLHGTLNATAGGTLVLENPNHMTAYTGGDQWRVIDLNSGAGSITGTLAVNDSSLGLTTGFIGSFSQATGIYSIADIRDQLTAYSSGLPMANAESQAIIAGVQTGLNDVNNHLFNLRAGGGEEDDDGSISASLDNGVIVGEGDGDKNPIARQIKPSRQWQVFTTVNYGNAKLSPISNQAGVQVDSWASSVGIERHVSRSVIVGFAATFLQSTQTYTGGLGKVDLEGPMLSAYVSYVHKGFWSSLLYSFGDFDLGSQRNPGLGLPTAGGGTRAYTNAIQYNEGYNFRFQNNTLVTGPFVGIDYLHGSVDAYSETGGGVGALRYNKQSFESLVTRIGWSTSKKFETNWAHITPQFRLSYERQNLKNNGTSVSLINAPFSASGGNQTPGQDYMLLGTGVNFQFTPDFSMLLGYQVQLFRNNMQTHFGTVRFGYKF